MFLMRFRLKMQVPLLLLKEDSVEPEDSMIYEHLGTIWQLTQLGELGLKKENARLIQLSFYVYYNEAKEEYADTGYWAAL